MTTRDTVDTTYAALGQAINADRADAEAQLGTAKAFIDQQNRVVEELTATVQQQAAENEALAQANADLYDQLHPHVTYFGMSVKQKSGETAAQAVARLRTQYAALPAVRVFQEGAPVAKWADNAILAALKEDTKAVSYSAKGDLNAYANGGYDSRLDGLFSSIPDSVEKFDFAVWHEPEDDIEKGAFTYDQLKAAQRGARKITDKYPKVRLAFIGMTWTLERNSGRDWHNYVSEAVEQISWDRYNAAWDAKPTPFYRDPADLFQPAIDIAAQTGLPWAICESGSPNLIDGSDASGDKRAAWLRACGQFCADNKAEYVLYWNRPALAAGGADYSLDDAPSVQAWKDLIATTA